LEEGAEDGESWYDFVERVNLRFELERNREEGYACDMRKRCVFVQKEYQTLPRYIREREATVLLFKGWKIRLIFDAMKILFLFR